MGIEKLHHEHMDAYILAGLTWEEYRLQPATYHVGRTTWWRRKQALLAAGQPVKTDRQLISAGKGKCPDSTATGERLVNLAQQGDTPEWPEACRLLETGSRSALWFPADAALKVELPSGGESVCLLPVLDSYLVAWAADLTLLKRITAQLVATPDLYLCVLGDLDDLVEGMRRRLAVHGTHLPAGTINRLVRAWLKWIEPKIAFIASRNTSAKPAGIAGPQAPAIEGISLRTLFVDSSAHLNLKVSDQHYKVAVSARLRRHSLSAALQHCFDYRDARHAGPDAILLQSTRSAAMMIYSHVADVRAVVLCGTIATPIWGRAGLPCITFDAHRHAVTCFPSLTSWSRATGNR